MYAIGTAATGGFSTVVKPVMPRSVKQGSGESPDDGSLDELDRLRERIAQLEERVRHLDALAHQDPLIGLANRRGFMRELDTLLDRVRRYDESAAMLFIDLDGLKQINDRFGHKAGDEALMQVACLLREGVRKSDCVARIGGDEFGILLAHTDEARACDTAQRLTSQIENHDCVCDGNSVKVAVAIGVTMIAQEDTPEAVIARADRAMYQQKAAA